MLKSMPKIFIPKLIFLSLVVSLAGCASGAARHYGTWERYAESEPLNYPDFHVVFRGKKPNNFYPGESQRRLGDVYVFEVSNASEKVEVLWSEGTGVIGPQDFSIGGESYMLEMFGSDILRGGFVDENNIAIWPMEEFERERNKPWWMFW